MGWVTFTASHSPAVARFLPLARWLPALCLPPAVRGCGLSELYPAHCS